MKFGSPKAERVRTIDANVNDSSNIDTYPIKIKGKTQRLRQFRVSIDFPKYRVENGRTQTAQQEYNERHSKKVDFFVRDPESTTVQKAQHNILKELMDGSVNLINQAKVNDQEQPLVLTNLGYVLNGNRRLCAYREVYDSDPKKFMRYQNVDVIALPYMTEAELSDLEAHYQTAESWEKDYSWIDEAFLYRKALASGSHNEKSLAHRDNKKEKDLKELISTINFADEYLKWLKKPNIYSLIGQQEHSFRRLVSNIDKKSLLTNTPDRQVFKSVVFQLIADPSLAGRTYTKIPEIAKNLTALRKQLKVEISPTPKDDKALVTELKKPKNRAIISQVVTDVIDAANRAKKSRKTADASLRDIRNANASLKGAILSKTAKSDLTGLTAQVKEIQSSIRKIAKW